MEGSYDGSRLGCAWRLRWSRPRRRRRRPPSDVWNAASRGRRSRRSGADIKPERVPRVHARPVRPASRPAAARRRARAAPRGRSTVLSLPAPDGGFQRFAVYEAPIMEAGPRGQASGHQDLRRPRHRRPDRHDRRRHEPARLPRLRALGRRRLVRRPVLPAPTTASTSATSRATSTRTPHGAFVEREPIGESDRATAAFSAGAVAGPAIQLRTYRLALITDPTYATYFGGRQRHRGQGHADEPRQPDLRGRDRDPAGPDRRHRQAQPQHRGAHDRRERALRRGGVLHGRAGRRLRRRHARAATGSCSARSSAPSNYDVGHIALGNSGGGVASLGVVGGNSKAQGCTGLPTPVGDFFAVDYVAHEMGHQFAGNHTFNGTQSTARRQPQRRTSVEPGSGSSIMAYAGICQQDNLQPHSDPYWSPRSYDEILALVTGDRAPINEVQNISLRDFDGTDSLHAELRPARRRPRSCAARTTPPPASRPRSRASTEVQTVALDRLRRQRRLVPAQLQAARTACRSCAARTTPRRASSNAIAGGNEQQQVTLTGFNGTTQSFQIQINGVNSADARLGRPRGQQRQRGDGDQRHRRLRRHASRRPARATPASR